MGLFENMMKYADAFKRETATTDAQVSNAAKRSPRERELLHELADKAEAGTPAVRYALLFSGTVQGVGFRWTNQSLAQEHHLTGWIRNLDDGTVEAELQGPPAACAAHFARLHAYYSRFRNTIWLERADELPLVPGDRDFSVRG